MYASQFQAKLQACQNSGGQKGDELEDGTRSGDDDQASRNSGDEDSQSPAANSSRRNGDGSVDEDGSDDRSTPRSWTKGEECKKLSPTNTGSKALTAS